MKAAILVFPLVTLLLTGCNDSPRQPGSAASAPADYLKSAANSQKRAVKTIDIVALNKTIETFYVQEGRFPKSLDELVDKNFLRALPQLPPGVKFNYDTNNGLVTVEKE